MQRFLWLLAFVFCVHSLQAANIKAEPIPPTRVIGLYIEKKEKGTITTIQLAGDDIFYKVVAQGKVVEQSSAHPSDEDWFKFIQGLNTAKVYQWAPKYYYPGQGPSWTIDLTMADRELISSGTNEYPKEGDEAKPQADPKAGESVPFKFFWQAAMELAGKTTAAPKAAPAKQEPAPAEQ